MTNPARCVAGDAIKPTVSRDKLRFCATRDVSFSMPASRRGGKNKGRKTGGCRAEEVLRTTAGTVTLLPFDLRGGAKSRGALRLSFHLETSPATERGSSFCLANLSKVVAAEGGRPTARINTYEALVYVIGGEMAISMKGQRYSFSPFPPALSLYLVLFLSKEQAASLL